MSDKAYITADFETLTIHLSKLFLFFIKYLNIYLPSFAFIFIQNQHKTFYVIKNSHAFWFYILLSRNVH